jgi:hypothetical protein
VIGSKTAVPHARQPLAFYSDKASIFRANKAAATGVRVPRHDGQDSGLMTDSIPE